MTSVKSTNDIKHLEQIQETIWSGRIPLEIRLDPSESRSYDRTEPYMISQPRLSNLCALLPRLLPFFSSDMIADSDEALISNGYFTHEGLPVKWHLPLGLLYDIYVLSTAEVSDPASSIASTTRREHRPFCIIVHFKPAKADPSAVNHVPPTETNVHDAYINSVKEADFLRSGTAKPIMSLGAEDSKLLFQAASDTDLTVWSRIYKSLLPTTSSWRNIPVRLYIPAAVLHEPDVGSTANDSSQSSSHPYGSVKVVQGQLPPFVSGSASSGAPQALLTSRAQTQQQRQTLGTALNTLIPVLFPSRRTPILAKPMLHGAIVPLNADLQELAEWACYADGWVNIVVCIIG